MVKITVICIPTLDEKGLTSDLSMHFGKTPYFTFIRIEDGEIKDVDTVESFSKHKGGSRTPAEIILNSDAKILICGNLGQKAVYMLRESDLEVFSGASGKVEKILKNWQDGKLIFADENSCNEKSC